MNNIFKQLEELKDALLTNVDVDWSENDPSTEFSALADKLNNLLNGNLTSDCRELLKEEGFFVENLWCSGDIIGTGENMGQEISEEQALEIMGLMGRRFDATIGINWDFIEVIIEEFFNNQ